MIETIQVGRVLREAVAAPYRNLVTRPTGVAVRHRIEATLDDSSCVCAYLDFSDIDLLDLSCADEVVAKLLTTPTPRRSGQFLVLQGLREDQHEAIEHVLTRQHLAVAAVPPGAAEPSLLGWATADGHAAFECVRATGPLTTTELADRLGWTESRAHQALCDLALHRVIRFEHDVYAPLPSA